MELGDWADQIVLDLDNFGSFGKLMPNVIWQEWAIQLVANVGLSKYNPPNPYSYDDWELWAERFIHTIS